MHSPPRRTVNELFLHMADELLVYSAVMPKKSRNIFAPFSESLNKRSLSDGLFRKYFG